MAKAKCLVIGDVGIRQRADEEGADFLAIDQVREEIRERVLLGRFWKYTEARFVSTQYEKRRPPFLVAVLLGFLSRGQCYIEGYDGVRRMGWLLLAEITFAWFVGVARARRATRAYRPVVRLLERIAVHTTRLESRPTPVPALLEGSPVYLRTDLWFGGRAGGSLAHIGGVFNSMARFGGAPILFSSDPIPSVDPDAEVHIIRPRGRFTNDAALEALDFNATFVTTVLDTLKDRGVSFVYQRYSINSIAGIEIARRLRKPFVLEFNGSEIWASRNWGGAPKWVGFELSERIEAMNLRAADLVVVVSEPIREQIEAIGVDPERILVNPNGVDPTTYRPDVDGSKVRGKYSLAGKTVIGFIGTFGRWHGADVLAEAFRELLAANPRLREVVHLLMIGDGTTRPACERILVEAGLQACCSFTGIVPQREGPFYLAACDILVSPTVAPPDGSRFFGSPTKLFEYMAMGRAIVASRLEQLGEVLDHGRTALLVPPGSVADLAGALKQLVEEPHTRERLGAGARESAVAAHTWEIHTRRIFERIARLGGEPRH